MTQASREEHKFWSQPSRDKYWLWALMTGFGYKFCYCLPWALKVGKSTVLQCLCLKVDIGILWFTEVCCKDWLWQWHSLCGLCTSASPWTVCNQVGSKYRKFKKAGNSEPSATAMTSTLRMGGILNNTETKCECGTCRGRCTLAVHSESVIRWHWLKM